MNELVLNRVQLLKWFFLSAVFAYLTIQGFFPDIERKIPWGEAFCFCLFFTVFKMEYSFSAQKRIIQCAHFWLFFAPLYALWVTLVFWKDEYVLYYLFRSLVPFYYVVFFFFAYRWGPDLLDLLGRFKYLILILALAPVFSRGVGIGSSVVLGVVWLGVQNKNEKGLFFWLTYSLLVLTVFFGGGGGSSKATVLVLLLAPFMMLLGYWWATFRPPFFFQKLLVRIVLFGIFLLMIYGSKLLLDDFYDFLGAGLTQNEYYSIEGVVGTTEFANENAQWRLFMWAYVLGQFWKFPQGIGLGTPLLGADMGKFFGWGIGDFEEMQFALGAHNSFLTILGRLGVVALLFFILLGVSLSRIIKNLCGSQLIFKRGDPQFRLAFGSLFVFLIALVQASFNMMIETPLYAAHFWFPLGLFVRLSGDYIAKQQEKIRVTV